jgi:hypothetical protein
MEKYMSQKAKNKKSGRDPFVQSGSITYKQNEYAILLNKRTFEMKFAFVTDKGFKDVEDESLIEELIIYLKQANKAE